MNIVSHFFLEHLQNVGSKNQHLFSSHFFPYKIINHLCNINPAAFSYAFEAGGRISFADFEVGFIEEEVNCFFPVVI
ncbi:predicted protein [Methanosarcina acetivorans C2A]|uniref:Uncharacterized protein n=1 Tax=Methanosarcina acetivorans (strain ATCC 35395 / DSM 2834 / JCM 12185 / C2A) TaxID=188937 RepID=Q8TR25_METAC|nr:predicted protein [Methanosarcina acetivorans C2A]